jgi:hypothetical protein
MNKINIENEHFKGRKAAAFTDVPEGYFQQLHENVSKKISENETQFQKRDLWPRAIAAAFLILLATGTFLLFLIQPVYEGGTAQLNDSTINEKSDMELLSLSNETVTEINADKLNFNLSNQLPEASMNDSSLFQDISIEEMMSYLIEKEEFEF